MFKKVVSNLNDKQLSGVLLKLIVKDKLLHSGKVLVNAAAETPEERKTRLQQYCPETDRVRDHPTVYKMSTDLISHPQKYHGLLPVRLSPINDVNTELIYGGQN